MIMLRKKFASRQSWMVAASMLVLAGACPALAQSVDSSANGNADAQVDNDEIALDEIIVTASKRPEKLQNVPGAITTLSGEKLENLGVQNFRDYAGLVPGLSQRDNGAPGLGSFIIRGLNSGSSQLTSTSAFYVDETPFTASAFGFVSSLVTPDVDLTDVDRIEVLKGPQGTLYGAGSLGGLIRIVSKKPDASDFSANARIEGTAIEGGGTGGSGRLSLNVPLIADKLAIRAVGLYRRSPGYATNLVTGRENNGESYGGRISLRATPTPELTIDLSATLQDLNSNGRASQDTLPDSLTPLSGRYLSSTIVDESARFKYRIYSGTVDYQFGDLGTLTTSVTKGQTKSALLDDRSTSLNVPGVGVLGPSSINFSKWTVESRFVSKRLGPVEFIVGGFYTNEKNSYLVKFLGVDPETLAPLPAPFDALLDQVASSTYEEIAGFGNLTFYMTDNLDVTGGMRFARNTQSIAIDAVGPAVGGIIDDDFEFTDDSPTYLATLRWRPTSNLSFFARAASGYRPGGPQVNPTPPPGAQKKIRPDTVWNYELGAKGGTADGKFNFAASIYQIDWKDIQLNTLINNLVLLTNGGAARIQGFEAEATVRPVPTLTMTASFGITNPKLTRVDESVTSFTGALAGDTLLMTPQYTMAITADKIFPIGDESSLDFGGTLNFQSEMNSQYTGIPTTPNVKVPSYATVDLRAGYTFGKYRAQFRVDNLLNEFAYSTYASPIGTPIQPRSFTLSLSADF
jgi:iron complex outermembrane recepter protein